MSVNKTRLLQGDANAKSQTRKSMKINVICTVHIFTFFDFHRAMQSHTLKIMYIMYCGISKAVI